MPLNHPSPFTKGSIKPMDVQAPLEAKKTTEKSALPPRELLMAKECALKCSVQMAQTWGDWMKKSSIENDDLVIAQKLKFHQETFYKEFIGLLIDDDSIPF